MVRRMIGGITLACVVTVPLAGCGGEEKPDPEIVWAGRVCDSVKKNTKKVMLPAVDAKNARKTRTAVLTFLGDMSNQLQAQANTLSAAGAPPVAGGEATYKATLANLTKVRMEMGGVVAGLRKAKVTDMKSLTKALSGYQRSMSQFSSYQGPAKDLRGNTALNNAFSQTPQCKDIGV